MPQLDAVRDAFRSIDADPVLKDQAVENIRTWLTRSDYATYRPQIEWLIETGKWSTLLDSFYQMIPFGTGGRRGAVGIGPNRMNLWTVGSGVQGHCEYLKRKFPGVSPIKVVLAYDARQFEDTRQVYNPELPNPVLNLSSREFCHYACGVYAANGIRAYILPADSQAFVPTPELSFTIRYLQAHGGLNMTASHNPPDDNGCKFYNEFGAQPVPPDDQLIIELVQEVEHVKALPWVDAVRSGKVQFLEAPSHRAYIDLCRRQSLIPPPKQDEVRVVYTPLEGVGGFCAGETLTAAGYQWIPVPEQNTPDGRFRNVTKSPNPEVPESMDRAAKVAAESRADLAIATDPDADRIGGLACTTPDGRGPMRFLTGNEIAALLTYFKLNRLAAAGAMPANPVVVTTEVTTGQITPIARHYGSQIVNDLLVGFKYHADVIHHLESGGRFGDVTGTPAGFIIGTEESHGVLATPGIRDKDAACAALLMAELALFLKRQGRTIPELLSDMARQFGYFRNEVLNIALPGIEGKVLMSRMLDALRSSPPRSIGGMQVVGFEDLRDENGRMGAFKGETDRAARNFLIFRLSDTARSVGGKVCLRPSGTEPKAKAYLEVSSIPYVVGTTESDWASWRKSVDDGIQKVASDFLAKAMGTVGLTPAVGADELPTR